jgi:hypothetical protein
MNRLLHLLVRLIFLFAETQCPAPLQKNHPWRCLCLGLLVQITRTTPLRLMTLHPMHNFLTDARTFTTAPPGYL